jgi:hypothetical protein
VFSIVFFWRGGSPLKTVGYENAGYGNSAHCKRDPKAGFGWEDYNRGLGEQRGVRDHRAAYQHTIPKEFFSSQTLRIGVSLGVYGGP